MTTTAVPSKLPEDFALNIENLDKFSNSTSPTFTNRLGVSKKTLSGIVAAGQMALSVEVYATTAAGLAATTSGKYFSVPSADSAEYLILYLNSAGTAVEQKRYPAADAVSKPTWAGKISGWPDPFFRHSEIGVDFLSRQRWRSTDNNGFAALAKVASSVFAGNALRRTGPGVVSRSGPVVWLDEMGAAPGDTVTLYALLSGTAGRDAYLFGRFYSAAGVLASAPVSGGDFQAVSDTGTTGAIFSGAPRTLRITAVVPANAAAIALYPYSTTQAVGESLDVHAVWAFKGGVNSGPAWPSMLDASSLIPLAQTVAAHTAEIATLDSRADALDSRIGEDNQVKIKAALTNPLFQFLGLPLLGDSITWGMTASGMALETPRAGVLADPRSNGTSASWANLLHKFLGAEYYDDAAATEAAWPGSPGGVAQFTYNKTVDLFPATGDFSYTNSNTAGGKGAWTTPAYATESLLGKALNAVVTLSSDNLRLAWRMTGYEFDLVHAQLSNGAKYELLVDGVSQGIFSTQTGDTGNAVAFGYVTTHSLGGFRRNALVELRVVPGDVARTTLRIEAIRIKRVLRVTNQGIIGTNTWNYLGMLATAVRDDDSFAFLQLGTNDRVVQRTSGNTAGQASFAANIITLVNALEARGIGPILCCAGAVTADAAPTYVFSMGQVRAVLQQIAATRKLPLIDHYAVTRPLVRAGNTTWLADGLHPNDSGHLLMFNTIRKFFD